MQSKLAKGKGESEGKKKKKKKKEKRGGNVAVVGVVFERSDRYCPAPKKERRKRWNVANILNLQSENNHLN